MTANTFYVIRTPEAAARMDESFEDRRETDSDLIVVSTHGDQRDIEGAIEIKYEQETVAEWFDGPIPDIVLDLLETALATYAADRSVERQITIPDDDHRARVNTRNLHLTIPVLSERLSTASAEQLLAETVSRTSRDLVEYSTYQPTSLTSVSKSESAGKTDAVSLFSGGLDSTGGVFYNRKQGIDASYVSLNYGSGVKPVVSRVSERADIDPEVVGIEYVGRSRELTQFSRGFLHLVFGVAAAVGRGVPTVQSFENGLVARFDILQDAWMTTRTVSPEFIAAFSALLNEVGLTDVHVQNPFADWTKTDVVDQIPGAETALATVSCPHSHKFNGYEHDNCGLCVPCILRTVALYASRHSMPDGERNIYRPFVEADFERMELELSEWPPDSPSINEQAVSPEVFIRAVAEIAYFCRHMLGGREQALARDHPELYDADVLELHRGFAEEFEVAMNLLEDTNPSITRLLEP